MTDTLMWIYLGVLSVAAIASLILMARENGRQDEEIRLAESNKQASKKAKDVETAINSMSDSDVRDAASRWVRKE